jgi:PIN domain nuclease of toxin-antitoxin system
MLWLFDDDDRLSENAKEIITDPENRIFISIASFWEIAIKMSLSKLVLDIPFEKLFDECEKLDFNILNISKRHLLFLKTLPFVHRDPFDRLIVCQAIIENCTLVSADRAFLEYNIKTIK